MDIERPNRRNIPCYDAFVFRRRDAGGNSITFIK